MSAAKEEESPPKLDRGGKDDSAANKRWLAIFLLVTIGLVAFGMWSMWPYSQQQEKRLEAWKGWLIWVFDVQSMIWFLRVFYVYFVAGRPLNDDGPRPHPGPWIIGTLLAGFAIDAVASVAVLMGERASYHHAVTTTGTVTHLAVGHERPVNKYKVTFEFQDKAGQLHSSFATIRHSGGGFPEGISEATWDNLKKRQPGFTIGVAYDPDWPDRCWLQEVGFNWSEFFSEDLSGLSLVFLVAQLMMMPGFLFDAFSRRECRWWLQVYEGFPLAIEAVLLALAGLYRTWLF
jgi:hypothetical protein